MIKIVPPVASVIIPAHNAGEWIAEQLDALCDQEDSSSFEVLVCDNNSTDNTASEALRYAEKLDLRVIDASGPASASYARNCGALEAHGEVLLFCDSDDLVGPRWVRSLHSVVAMSPQALAVGALHHERFNDPETLAAYGIGPDPKQEINCGITVTAPPFAGYLPTVAGGNFAIRKDRYLAVGGMDSSYPGGAEETDFSWRAQATGMHVLSVPGAVVHYRLRKDSRGIFRQQRIQQYARVLLWVRYAKKGMSGPSFSYSVREIASQLPQLLAQRRRAEQLRTARILGGNVGALQGMFTFRILRRLPWPQTIHAVADVKEVKGL